MIWFLSEHPNYFDREEYMCQANDTAKGEDSSASPLQSGLSAEALKAECAGCGLAYGSTHWADFVVSNEVWAKIAPQPDGYGLLCVTCMIGRCVELGIEDPTAKFTSGPFAK